MIGSFQKKPAFKGFNRKTLNVMARIQRNPSLKENIAKTKLVRSRWKVAKEQVLTSKALLSYLFASRFGGLCSQPSHDC